MAVVFFDEIVDICGLNWLEGIDNYDAFELRIFSDASCFKVFFKL